MTMSQSLSSQNIGKCKNSKKFNEIDSPQYLKVFKNICNFLELDSRKEKLLIASVQYRLQEAEEF